MVDHQVPVGALLVMHSEEAIAGCVGPAFGCQKIGCITMGPEDYVAGYVVDNCMRIHSTIIQQLNQCFNGGLHSICLLCSQCA